MVGCVVIAQLLAHGVQLSYGVLAPSVAWRYRVMVTDTGRTRIYVIKATNDTVLNKLQKWKISEK